MHATEMPDSDSPNSKWLPFLANATLFYPLLPLALLYGEWLLAWCVLGHTPRPSLDDPKYIDGSSWMHPLVYLAFAGSVPGFFASLPLNLVYAYDDQLGWPIRLVRIGVFLFLWAGLAILLASDPGRVIYWWLD